MAPPNKLSDEDVEAFLRSPGERLHMRFSLPDDDGECWRLHSFTQTAGIMKYAIVYEGPLCDDPIPVDEEGLRLMLRDSEVLAM